MTYELIFNEQERCYQILDERENHVWVPGQDVAIEVFEPFTEAVESWEIGFRHRTDAVCALGTLIAKEKFFRNFVGPESPFDIPF